MVIECRATKGSRSPSWSISPIMANERQSVSTATRAVSHRARNCDTSVAHSAECEKRHIGGTSECSVEFEKGHIGGTSEWRHMGGRHWCSCIFVYVALCTTLSHRPRSILPSVLNGLFLGSRERFLWLKTRSQLDTFLLKSPLVKVCCLFQPHKIEKIEM